VNDGRSQRQEQDRRQKGQVRARQERRQPVPEKKQVTLPDSRGE